LTVKKILGISIWDRLGVMERVSSSGLRGAGMGLRVLSFGLRVGRTKIQVNLTSLFFVL